MNRIRSSDTIGFLSQRGLDSCVLLSLNFYWVNGLEKTDKQRSIIEDDDEILRGDARYASLAIPLLCMSRAQLKTYTYLHRLPKSDLKRCTRHKPIIQINSGQLTMNPISSLSRQITHETCDISRCSKTAALDHMRAQDEALPFFFGIVTREHGRYERDLSFCEIRDWWILVLEKGFLSVL